MKTLLFVVIGICVVYGHPSLLAATKCQPASCLIEDDCRCSSAQNPISNTDDLAPQLIAITVSESVVTTLYAEYLQPLFFNRKNPDGNPISLTFYVNHEYTDYELVHNLYVRGYELGVHSITKNSSQEYWKQASLDDLVEEFGGQRQIISHFANIPIEDINGARSPQLQLEGDLSIDAYVQAGLSYDNSWPTRSSLPLFPYTLDFASTQECMVAMKCPEQPHEHFWVAPITNIQGNNSVECNSLATCLIQGTAQEIADWLIAQVDSFYYGNRAPLVLRLDSYWFQFTDNSLEGFEIFLNEITTRKDAFLVSVQDIVDWVKHPVVASTFQTPVHDRSSDCNPINCAFTLDDGSERYMKSCIQCPLNYPWKGNPLGE